MSIEVLEIGSGYSVVIAEIQQKHMNPYGSPHGGVYASLIDAACWLSVYCDIPEVDGLVTIDLTVDLLSPLTGGRIIAKGKKIKLGKTLCLAEATMYNSDEMLAAHGTSKLMVTHNQQLIKDLVKYSGLSKPPDKFIEN